MAQIVTKYAAKKMLGKQMEKYRDKDVVGSYDPFYAYVEHPTKKGKKKKVKRQIPDYIPAEDAIILAKMRQRAYWLDMSLFNLFGVVRFGWSSVIGLIPAAGDAIDFALAVLLVMRCSKISCGLGNKTRFWMAMNIIVDFFIGLVPVVGDLADAGFRANSKNVRLLEERLDEVYKPEGLKRAESKAGIHKPPATVYEDFESDNETGRLPRHRQDVEPQRPQPARVRTDTSNREHPSRKGTLKSDSRRDSRRDRR